MKHLFKKIPVIGSLAIWIKKKILSINYILIAYYSVFVIGIAGLAMISPSLNWDMLGYVGSALHFEYSNIDILHNKVFQGLKDFVSPQNYEVLTNPNRFYRHDMATNAQLYAQQLPFYQIRPIYNILIYLLYKIGLNIFFATYLISIVAVALSIVVLFKTFIRKIDRSLMYIIPIALLSYGILSVAKASTPDALLFLGLSLFIKYIMKNNINKIYILLPILILVRTDIIIFNIIFYIYIIYTESKISFILALSAVLSLIFYFSTNILAGNYGWSAIFTVTLIERVSNPADLNFSVSIIEYFSAFFKGMVKSATDHFFMSYLVLLCMNVILFKLKGINKYKNEIIFFIFASFFYILLHFLLFPVTWCRFFIGFYLMNFVATILIIDNLIKNYNNASNPV